MLLSVTVHIYLHVYHSLFTNACLAGVGKTSLITSLVQDFQEKVLHEQNLTDDLGTP